MAAASSSQPSVSRIEGIPQLTKYLPLYQAILQGNLKTVKEICDRRAVAASISMNFDTPLHVAVGTGWNLIVKHLLPKMRLEQLALRNNEGNTILSVAAIVGNVEAAKLIVETENKLKSQNNGESENNLTDIKNRCGWIPLLEAARHGQKDAVTYLLPFSKDHLVQSLQRPADKSAVSFMNLLVVAGFYDVALELVKDHPGLGTVELYGGDSLLSTITRNPTAFPSGAQFNFWQRIVYHWMHIQDDKNIRAFANELEMALDVVKVHRGNHLQGDVKICELAAELNEELCGGSRLQDNDDNRAFANELELALRLVKERRDDEYFRLVDDPETGSVKKQCGKPLQHAAIIRAFSFLSRACETFQAALWKTLLILVPNTKEVQEIKVKHCAVPLVHLLCMIISTLDHDKASKLLKQPLLLGAESGIVEVVEEILLSFPHAVWSSDARNHNIFQLAVIHRREKVFNLVFQMSKFKHLLLQSEDTSGNNILHLAGKLAPQHQLSLISGAALQMQHELQWFKEVEKIVQSTYKTVQNSHEKTPSMVFTEKHKELVKEGEKWMKDTANSCTLAATLIATIVFAAAITIPGGNNNETGHPIFSKNKAFTIFGVSDTLSLFSSVAAIIMFLSVLTARYAEEDFRHVLPKRLIWGLVMLFLSITSMLVAFSSTVYLVFCDEKAWTLIPVGGLACLLVSLFVSSQFPLLVDMISSTYGPGIFGKQRKNMIC